MYCEIPYCIMTVSNISIYMKLKCTSTVHSVIDTTIEALYMRYYYTTDDNIIHILLLKFIIIFQKKIKKLIQYSTNNIKKYTVALCV